MNDKDFKPLKAMGQNFLRDENISRKIVKFSGIDKTCGVLEVGPGFGALTRHLADAAGHVTALELDTRLMAGLRDMQSVYPNLSIVQGDVLKVNLRVIAEQTLPELHHHVCANLPYYITTPAISRFLESGVFEAVTVTVQREVAERICAAPGSPQYGAFTVFVNYHAEPEMLFDIPPECFRPRPKVTSSVVRMVMREVRRLSGDEERIFFRVVRAAFGQRRKTLANALFAAFGDTHDKDALLGALDNCGFDPRVRGERLSIEEFMKLSSVLQDCNYL